MTVSDLFTENGLADETACAADCPIISLIEQLSLRLDFELLIPFWQTQNNQTVTTLSAGVESWTNEEFHLTFLLNRWPSTK